MPAINLYCNVDDIRAEIPLKVGAKNTTQRNKIVSDEVINSFCLRVSALMDRTFSQNNYITPINYGDPSGDSYDQLLDLSLREIAINGVCSKIYSSTMSELDEDPNIYENMFLDGLTSIIRKGFPSYVKKVEGSAPLELVTVKTQRQVPYFSDSGINFDSG